jgi:hypothetical protein
MAKSPPPIQFGFLPYNWNFNFCSGKIVPVPEFDEALKSLKKCLHADGYFYPPTQKTVTADSRGKDRTVPKTKRPAHLFRLPASHQLQMMFPPESDIRESSAGFVIHLLAFLFATRLQFADWFSDGRVPLGRRHRFWFQIMNSQQAERCLDHSFKIWSPWSKLDRKRFTNILYMFSRGCVYEWDWEEFIIQYMVFDGLWKMGEQLHGLPTKTAHKHRARKLCAHFGFDVDNWIQTKWIDVDKMAELRNDLFHETLWHGGRPSSTIGRLGYSMPVRMSVLNETLIAKFLQLL